MEKEFVEIPIPKEDYKRLEILAKLCYTNVDEIVRVIVGRELHSHESKYR